MSLRKTIGLLLGGAVAYVVVASVAILLAIGLLPRTGWYRTLTVLSGSMRPTFAAGDLVVARPKPVDDLRVGDVLLYQIPIGDHHLESHRVVQILGRSPNVEVRTKGDANQTADPWTAVLDGNTVWTVRGTVPWVGQAILWLRSPRQHRIATYLLPAIVVMLLLAAIWRRDEEDDAVLDTNVVRFR